MSMYYNEHDYTVDKKRCQPCYGSGKIGASAYEKFKEECPYCKGVGHVYKHVADDKAVRLPFSADKIDRRSKSFKEAINKIMQADESLSKQEAEDYFFNELKGTE